MYGPVEGVEVVEGSVHFGDPRRLPVRSDGSGVVTRELLLVRHLV